MFVSDCRVNNALTWQNPGHQEEDGENCEERRWCGKPLWYSEWECSSSGPTGPGAFSHLISLGMFVYCDPWPWPLAHVWDLHSPPLVHRLGSGPCAHVHTHTHSALRVWGCCSFSSKPKPTGFDPTLKMINCAWLTLLIYARPTPRRSSTCTRVCAHLNTLIK